MQFRAAGSRRSFLLSALASAGLSNAQTFQGRSFPAEARRYADPTTELDVYRLTDPRYGSSFPAYYSRAITRNSGGLLFLSDRTGTAQGFRMDLKTGEAHQLTDTADLDGTTLTLTPDNRSIVFFAGRSLNSTGLGNLRQREVYRIPEGWERGTGMSVGPDGTHALFVERSGDKFRLRMVPLARGEARTVLEAGFPMAHPIARPMRAQILYQAAGGLWLVNSDGRQNRKLKLTAGRIVEPNWSSNGKTILYLNYPEDPRQLHAIREIAPDAGTDKLVAKTSQFASFGFNRDSSVFAGASSNKGSPTVLVMLRITQSERTMCEHDASRPEDVTILFSPDSQRIYFQSDREGKSAIYALHVERLLEKTEEG